MSSSIGMWRTLLLEPGIPRGLLFSSPKQIRVDEWGIWAPAMIGGAAMDLFASTCVLSRWDAEFQAARRNGDSAPLEHHAADLFLRRFFRKIRWFLDGLSDNDDKAVNRAEETQPLEFSATEYFLPESVRDAKDYSRS